MIPALVMALVLTALAPINLRGDVQENAMTTLKARIGIDERLDGGAIAVALDRVSRRPGNLPPYFVRLFVDWPTLRAAATGDWRALDERLQLYAQRSVPVVLAIEGGPIAIDETGTWTQVMRAVSTHVGNRIAGYQIELDSGAIRPAPRLYAFIVRLVAVQVRAAQPSAVIVEGTIGFADVAWQRTVYDEGAAAVIDAVSIDTNTDASAAAGMAELTQLVRAQDPTAMTIRAGIPVGTLAQAPERMITTLLSQAGELTVAATFKGAPEIVAAALVGVSRVQELLTSTISTLDDRSRSLSIEAGGANITATLPHRLLYDTQTAATYLVYWTPTPGLAELTISLVTPTGQAPKLRDALRGDLVPLRSSAWDPATKTLRVTARVSASPFVLDLDDASSSFSNRTDVTAGASLSVEDIVFRNQQAEETQAQSFATVIALLRTKLHFRASPTQVFDVITDNRYFSSRDSVEWEEVSFSVNGTHWGSDHPGLPLLQSEKVLTLPLDLRLTTDYRYRLDGVESIDGRQCYVVAFEPIASDQSRYRGRVWIDGATFQRLKIQTIQTHLTGEITSSEEQTWFEAHETAAGRTVYLPSRLATKQVLLVAGQSLLLEKDQWFSDFKIDASDFVEQRQTARLSNHLMFRDTAEGIRHLEKRGDQRVVSTRPRTSSKALAMGTIIDPTFDFPLPIFGINYLNFRLRDRDNQLALLFGGVFVLGNIQTPKLGRTPFDASVDFFGIAVPGTDLRFDEQGERPGERVMTIPSSLGANIGYRFSPFHKVAAGYIFRHDAYFRAPDTAPEFDPPDSTVTHGVTARYEFTRHGYSAVAGGSAFARTSWTPWGGPGDYHPGDEHYRRYAAGFGKDIAFGPFQTVHVGAAWYGGAHLDRFNMYQFGIFDEARMHGVPGAGVRFPALVVARASYSFNLFNVYRLDLFLDQAAGRDPVNRDIWRPITGTGVAVTLKSPWNTMLTVDAGKSFLPAIYREAGSYVIQIMLLKPY